MIDSSALSPDNLRVAALGVDAWLKHSPTHSGNPDFSDFVPHPVSRMPSSISLSSVASDRHYSHLRPLPSPCPDFKKEKSSSDEDENRSGALSLDSPGSSAGGKTNAFFSSPFSIAVPRANHASNQPARSGSLVLPKRKGTRDSVDLDHSPSIFNTHDPRDNEQKSRVVSDSASQPKPPSRTQSMNNSFFFTPSVASSSATPKPPPPLPLTPATSPERHNGSHFSSISRFFPSRHTSKPPLSPESTDMTFNHQFPAALKGKSSTEGLRRSPSPLRRAFFELREPAQPAAFHERSLHAIASAGVTPEKPEASRDVVQIEVPSPQKSGIVSPEPHAHPNLPAHLHPIRRETQNKVTPSPAPQPGDVIGAPETPMRLIEQLGTGAFSSVWLAKDEVGELGISRRRSITRVGSVKRKGRRGLSKEPDNRGLAKQGSAGPRVLGSRRASQSIAKKEEDAKLGGLVPMTLMEDLPSSSPTPRPPETEHLDQAAEPSRNGIHDEDLPIRMPRSISTGSLKRSEGGRLVAVKMLDRALCDANDRTRISFVREVEVLRHISHPSIVSYLHSLTTPTHHCLVLEHVTGGELFDLINTDEKHARLTEPLLQRMFSELSRAVAWMHSVYLVHRDIKLENILLTCNPFAAQFAHPSEPDVPSLDLLPTPLLKLTDFGLSRFIDPASPFLATRCGSESYAAPEIVMGTKYDGRQTDAWACGVVLFALATRGLPFDRHGTTGRLSGEATGSVGGGSEYGGSTRSALDEHPERGRRSYLIRIAKNEWSWPSSDMASRLATPQLRKVVERLLVRDPKRRATLLDLWNEDWMNGPGGLPRPGEGFQVNIDEASHSRRSFSLERPSTNPDTLEPPPANSHDLPPIIDGAEQSANTEEDEEEIEESLEGVFVNADQIDSVARLDINY